MSRLMKDRALISDMPDLTQQKFVKPCFEDISTDKMHDVLKHMTSYYSRYYHSTDGEKSARWLHDHLSEVSPIDGHDI